MKFTIKDKQRIFSEFFRVDRLDLEIETFESGEIMPIRRYHLERPEVVALVVENTDNNSLVMVRQFRYSSLKGSPDGWTTEIVGGLIDPGESPEACALRESQEETGYLPKGVTYLTKFFATVGISDELIYLYHAQVTGAEKVSLGGGLAHENEDIEVVEIPFDQCLEQIKSGEINDSKTILGIQWLALAKAGVAPF